MSNSVDIDSKPYAAASPLKPLSPLEMFLVTMRLLLDLVVCFLKSIPLWVEIVLELFKTPPPKNISGQTALVTGGANGIGKAIATELAKEGCNVVVVDLDQTNGEKTAQELKRYNVQSVAYKVKIMLISLCEYGD